MFTGGSGIICTMIDPAQPITTTGEELEDLQVDHDLCDV